MIHRGVCRLMIRRATLSLVIGALAGGHVVLAQTSGPATVTLEQAVEQALANHPAVRAAAADRDAADAGVPIARAPFRPRLDAIWQIDRASTNNLVSTTLPQSVLPSVSGAVLPSSSWAAVWGSAAGVLFTWEPFDFGSRQAAVDAARSDAGHAAAQLSVIRLRVASAAVDAFLATVAAKQITGAAAANVTRWEAFARSVHVLVDNQLRAGADASRADAELAQARNRLIAAQTAEARTRAVLAETLGLDGASIDVDGRGLLASLPSNDRAVDVAAHPLALEAASAIAQAEALGRVLDHAWAPKVLTVASFSGKGSGVDALGVRTGGFSGLGLDRGNWAAGLQVTFPVLDFAVTRDEQRVQSLRVRAVESERDDTVRHLASQLAQANADLEGARRLAENTPAALEAARASETQTSARFQAGLATTADVSEAASLLVQAEIDDSLARLNVWRSLAEVAAAGGDLQPYLDLVRATHR